MGPVKLHATALPWTTLRMKQRILPQGPRTHPLHRSTIGRALPFLTGPWHCWDFWFCVGFGVFLSLWESQMEVWKWFEVKPLPDIWVQYLEYCLCWKNHWEACLPGVLMMGYSGGVTFENLESLNASWLPRGPSRCMPNRSSQWRSFWFKV